MPISVSARRLGYRLAYRVLALVWRFARARPNGVKCIITDGDRLLLVRHSYGPRGWDLPGGARHRDELPARTAEREMAEELGLTVAAAAWRDLGELRAVSGAHRIRILTAVVGEASSLRIDPVELEAAAWFPRGRLPMWTGPLLGTILQHVPDSLSPDDSGAGPGVD